MFPVSICLKKYFEISLDMKQNKLTFCRNREKDNVLMWLNTCSLERTFERLTLVGMAVSILVDMAGIILVASFMEKNVAFSDDVYLLGGERFGGPQKINPPRE